jgi:hypothetical protein
MVQFILAVGLVLLNLLTWLIVAMILWKNKYVSTYTYCCQR